VACCCTAPALSTEKRIRTWQHGDTSRDNTCPVSFVYSAARIVLPPGAAHRSITKSPGFIFAAFTARAEEASCTTDREDLKKKIEATGVHLSAHKELPYVYLAENLENVSELPGFS